MKQLTRAEEQVMQVLWELQKAYVRDILDKFSTPKPAYNTVSTVIRVLEKKGFVNHKSYGSTHEYYPIITKKEYTKFHFGEFMEKYFNNSFSQLASFFSQEQKISLSELEDMMKEIRKEVVKKEDRI